MKCGVCGDHYGELMVKHAELCDDDRKARVLGSPEFDDLASQLQDGERMTPEIDDIIKSIEESQGEDIH